MKIALYYLIFPFLEIFLYLALSDNNLTIALPTIYPKKLVWEKGEREINFSILHHFLKIPLPV
jgi:hypothetical protein